MRPTSVRRGRAFGPSATRASRGYAKWAHPACRVRRRRVNGRRGRVRTTLSTALFPTLPCITEYHRRPRHTRSKPPVVHPRTGRRAPGGGFRGPRHDGVPQGHSRHSRHSQTANHKGRRAASAPHQAIPGGPYQARTKGTLGQRFNKTFQRSFVGHAMMNVRGCPRNGFRQLPPTVGRSDASF